MIWIINFLIIIILIEAASQFKIKIKILKILTLSKKIFKYLSNKNLDIDKKKIIIERKIKNIIKLYINIFSILILVLLLILIVKILFNLRFSSILLNFIEINFILSSIIFIFLYLKVKKKIFNKKKYSFISKIFHKFVLNSNQRLKVLFEIEKLFFLKGNDNLHTQCLFITGLPRSGSTFFLQSLYNTNFFSSLKYSDMPFVTSPNLWSKINFFKKNILTHERAHQDGIHINLESPEAFEEIFWRSQLDNTYKEKIYYNKSYYNENIAYQFESFTKLVALKDKKKYYLSKNNNNVVRIKFLLNKLKKKKIVILFRNPLDHCISMLNQHENFINLQKKDKFFLDYMNMLSHYEFGLNHKPIQITNFKSNYLTNNINYWLEYWIMVYQNLINYSNHEDIIFLSFENFTDHPDKIIEKILNNLNINSKTHKSSVKKIKKKSFDFFNINKNVLISANNIYEKMRHYEIKISK